MSQPFTVIHQPSGRSIPVTGNTFQKICGPGIYYITYDSPGPCWQGLTVADSIPSYPTEGRSICSDDTIYAGFLIKPGFVCCPKLGLSPRNLFLTDSLATVPISMSGNAYTQGERDHVNDVCPYKINGRLTAGGDITCWCNDCESEYLIDYGYDYANQVGTTWEGYSLTCGVDSYGDAYYQLDAFWPIARCISAAHLWSYWCRNLYLSDGSTRWTCGFWGDAIGGQQCWCDLMPYPPGPCEGLISCFTADVIGEIDAVRDPYGQCQTVSGELHAFIGHYFYPSSDLGQSPSGWFAYATARNYVGRKQCASSFSQTFALNPVQCGGVIPVWRYTRGPTEDYTTLYADYCTVQPEPPGGLEVTVSS